MQKIFISQPMNGKTNEQIKEERNIAIQAMRDMFGEVEVLDSFFENAPHDAAPLWYLGEAIKLLSHADYAYFVSGWENARGCKIEHGCAVEYGIKVIHQV